MYVCMYVCTHIYIYIYIHIYIYIYIHTARSSGTSSTGPPSAPSCVRSMSHAFVHHARLHWVAQSSRRCMCVCVCVSKDCKSCRRPRLALPEAAGRRPVSWAELRQRRARRGPRLRTLPLWCKCSVDLV